MEKLKRGGQVAILVSPGFGAGWSTWADDDGEQKLFCPEIAQLLLDGADKAKIAEAAERLFPEGYNGGLDGLRVEWIEEGTRFEIHEYDGSESVRVFGRDEGYVA